MLLEAADPPDRSVVPADASFCTFLVVAASACDTAAAPACVVGGAPCWLEARARAVVQAPSPGGGWTSLLDEFGLLGLDGAILVPPALVEFLLGHFGGSLWLRPK